MFPHPHPTRGPGGSAAGWHPSPSIAGRASPGCPRRSLPGTRLPGEPHRCWPSSQGLGEAPSLPPNPRGGSVAAGGTPGRATRSPAGVSQAHETRSLITHAALPDTGSTECRHPTAGEAPTPVSGSRLPPSSAPSLNPVPAGSGFPPEAFFALNIIKRRYFLLPSLLETQSGGKGSRGVVPGASEPPRRWFFGSSLPSATPERSHLVPSMPHGRVGSAPRGSHEPRSIQASVPNPMAPCWGTGREGVSDPPLTPAERGETGVAPNPGSKSPNPGRKAPNPGRNAIIAPSPPSWGAPPAPGRGVSSSATHPATPGTPTPAPRGPGRSWRCPANPAVCAPLGSSPLCLLFSRISGANR